MAILINDNYRLSANKPFDDRYLNISTPWASCAEVIAGIPTYRYTGLTVNIAGNEYWWKDGIGDGDLVPKTLGGTSNLSGATNGLQLLCSNTYIGLGGELTQDTTIYGAYSLNLGSVSSGLTAISAITPTFHIQSANGNSSMNFSHDEDEPRYDVCLYGENADSNASMILDVDVNNGCFIANTAPNIICNSNLSLCTTDNNTKIFNVSSTNSNLKYNNEAWISSSCKMTCESITDRSNSALNIKSVMNYDDRSHNFIKDNSIILSVLSGGTARYGSNVTLNNDCDLAHKWYVDNVLGNISASNGLTRSGDDIILGGTLTGDTVIEGNNNSFCISDLTQYRVTGGTIELCATSAIVLRPDTSLTMYGGPNQILFANSSCKQLRDNDNFEGFVYAADYSVVGSLNPRWIPDAAWVTGQTNSSGVQTANNGLTKDGTNIRLGGDLTGNTTINGLDTHNLILDNINNLSLCSSSATTCATSEMLIRTPDFTLHNGVNNVMQITSSCNILTDNTNSEGFVYAGDYSSNGASNPRWIPDNAYVTGLTSGSIGTTSNGLTKIGSDIKLGGTLCEDTNICLGGSSSYDLNIINTGTTTYTLAEFNSTNINLSTSNINSPFEIGKICTTFNNTNISNGYANCYSEISLTKSLLDITICGGASNASFIVTDATTTPRGIEYAADYSSTFNDESLITKRYLNSNLSEITSIAITGATNGLTKVGQDVCLGGTLSGGAIISGNSSIMCLGTADSPLFQLYSDTCISTKFNNNVNGDKFFLLNNASAILYAEDADSSSRLDVHQDNGIEITLNGTTNAMYYNDDYSAKYNNRSIVDKEYIDNAISEGVSGITTNAITGATNGLTKSGQDVCLGGTLTNANLNGGTGSTFNITTGILPGNQSKLNLNSNTNGILLSYGTTNLTGDGVYICGTGGSPLLELGYYSDNIGGSNRITIDENKIEVEISDGDFKYKNDNSSNYTLRSIPDVNYVTGITNSIETQVAEGITGVTNGLTKVGQDVCLGGILNNETIISGGTNNDLCFGNLLSPISSIYSEASSSIVQNVGSGSYGNVTIDCCHVELSACDDSGSGFTSICLESASAGVAGIAISADNTLNAMYYTDDYSSKYTARSIPDVAWVTGQTSASGLHTASNGLSKSGTDVRLGGSFTQNTTILGSGYSINFGTAISQLTDFTVNGSNSISLIGDRGQIYADTCETRLASCFDASNFSEICLDQQGIKVTVCGTDGHMFYADDYSSTYTNRSIVDKEYIDNKANVVNVCQISTAYTTLRNDELIAVSGLSSNQICLYATPVVGQRLTVVDICGNAFVDPITVNGNGNNINDDVCSTINTDYGSVTYVFNGIFWSAVAFIN